MRGEAFLEYCFEKKEGKVLESPLDEVLSWRPFQYIRVLTLIKISRRRNEKLSVFGEPSVDDIREVYRIFIGEEVLQVTVILILVGRESQPA
jgi:hypothetical protein